MKNIGGQAVIEGVMMKSSKGWSVAVRDLKGDIHHKTVELKPLHKFFKLPVIRGFIALFHALVIGIKAIEFSGSIALSEDEKPMSSLSITFSILTALLLAVGLFIVLPLYATKLLGDIYGSVAESSVLFNLVDGILRVVVFLGYVTAIGLWKEMRRLYQYHGAEHKTIYAYEAGEELTVESARKYKPYHPRCGTSFLLIVMVISILVFSFIPQSWSFVLKFASRLVLIPLIAGISYEALKLSAKKNHNIFMKMVSVPGMFLQRLTAREPDDSQVEVAIAALKEVLALEKGKEIINA
ncbi:MAG: DUF1385 domain-containing protein [Dissulfurispiraceae bacterium]|jgi:uncharacterized protein YqhQ|nr:DUF1385 domain-containing protein [Dissulfurispiraceae bacterium]